MLQGRVIWKGVEYEARMDRGGCVRIPGGREIPAGEAALLTPTLPSKIVCVGRNYVEHAREMGNPVPERPLLFLKPPSACLSPGGLIRLPEDSAQVEYEGEIALVVGRTCRLVGEDEDPLSYLAGVTPLNDVTARDLQKLDVQFTRAKSFDTFCPFGPWVAPVPPLDELSVRTYLNGRMVQEGFARDMAFPIPMLVRYVSRVMTLLPGDLIATGTPAGVGKVAAGDTVAVEVAGVRLENPVGV